MGGQVLRRQAGCRRALCEHAAWCVEAAALGGQGGGSALLPSSDGKSGSVAGYDKLQLLDLKSDAVYVATKTQMLAAYHS